MATILQLSRDCHADNRRGTQLTCFVPNTWSRLLGGHFLEATFWGPPLRPRRALGLFHFGARACTPRSAASKARCRTLATPIRPSNGHGAFRVLAGAGIERNAVRGPTIRPDPPPALSVGSD